MPEKKVLIIIPAYNEGHLIRRLIKEIGTAYPHYPILVIDDGSQDNTADEARAGGAQVVRLPFNLGIGGAVQTGYKMALEEGYDIAVQMDGDAQHDPAYLPDILKPVFKDQLDLVVGSRFLGQDTEFRSTFLRRIGIHFFARLLSGLTGIHLTDPTSGFRAVGRKLIQAFARTYPVDFPEPETIQVAQRIGARIGEVPVSMRKRLGGKSSIRYWKTTYYMVKVTLAILIDTLRKKS